jgi:Cft2 family RNA processing exonuclease
MQSSDNVGIENPFGVRALTRGFQLEYPLVQLDTVSGAGPAIISHAHADHAAEDKSLPVIATPATADLLRARRHTGPIDTLPYDQWREFDGFAMKFLPAGHILGSAQVLIERADGLRFLYTGDVKTRIGRTAEPARFEHADDLLIESTFGNPLFQFPPEADVAGAMIEFARNCLDQGLTPVFLGYSLGKGQEIMSMLAEAEIPMLVHGSTWRLCEIYMQHGYSFGDAVPYHASRRGEPRAWVLPPWASAQMTRRHAGARTCFATGWALIDEGRSRFTQMMAPLSDHADFAELHDIVATVAPGRAWVFPGDYAATLAGSLARQFGIQSVALEPETAPEAILS